MEVRRFRAFRSGLFRLGAIVAALAAAPAFSVELDPPGTVPGYLAMLLINEAPFPGERGWESEADSRAAMRQILFVLDGRLNQIPSGYTQLEIAMVTSDDLIDIITAGGVHGQVEGFYRDERGRPVTVARVRGRLDYLVQVAGTGKPGAFARLLAYAQQASRDYVGQRWGAVDLFLPLEAIGPQRVTGRAYSWMTDLGQFHPGGRYVRIPDRNDGSLGGNRFFTLKRLGP
jgi:hypothetical protein